MTAIRSLLLGLCLILLPVAVLADAAASGESAASTPSAASPEADATVWLVRHAEKVDLTAESGLTEQGSARACALAHLLRSAGIERIHSSDYRRTRDTAAPLAARLGLDIELYDPRQLEDIAALLRQGGVHLVVGHSNTTPPLVRLLGGAADAMEDGDYDRLYRVTLGAGGVETLLLHTTAHCPDRG